MGLCKALKALRTLIKRALKGMTSFHWPTRAPFRVHAPEDALIERLPGKALIEALRQPSR